MTQFKFHSRPRAVSDWKCPRARYWNYEFDGTGLVKEGDSYALNFGTIMHEALGALALNGDPEAIFEKAATAIRLECLGDEEVPQADDLEYANEQSALMEGLIRGFYRQVWPELRQRYPEVLLVEEDIDYLHDEEFHFLCKPDLVLGNPVTEEVVYVEYKTTSSKKTEWVNSWNTAIQIHATARAIGQHLGRPVTSIIVQGLYKGFESYGKQSSPFCYAYKKAGNPPFSEDQISYEYKAGLKRTPTWELEGGLRKWVENMPDAILQDQFPQTPPIYIREDLMDAFYRQRVARENEIAIASQLIKNSNNADSTIAVLDLAFPQKFDQCTPSFGFPCTYKQLCFGHVADPFEAGFAIRKPHHPVELAACQERSLLSTDSQPDSQS
jgi:hypothetical protein